MKIVTLPLRVLVALVAIVWIWCLWACDGAREAWMKRKLGPAYEGPLDNEDLP